jgi:hypothetical protein
MNENAWNEMKDNEVSIYIGEGKQVPVFTLYGEDGTELLLQILAGCRVGSAIYVLAVAPDDDEVAHFKLVPSSDDNEDMDFYVIDDEHEEFEMVFELFEDAYEVIGIDVEELDEES